MLSTALPWCGSLKMKQSGAAPPSVSGLGGDHGRACARLRGIFEEKQGLVLKKVAGGRPGSARWISSGGGALACTDFDTRMTHWTRRMVVVGGGGAARGGGPAPTVCLKRVQHERGLLASRRQNVKRVVPPGGERQGGSLRPSPPPTLD